MAGAKEDAVELTYSTTLYSVMKRVALFGHHGHHDHDDEEAADRVILVIASIIGYILKVGQHYITF